jgi:hypothetical protein
LCGKWKTKKVESWVALTWTSLESHEKNWGKFVYVITSLDLGALSTQSLRPSTGPEVFWSGLFLFSLLAILKLIQQFFHVQHLQTDIYTFFWLSSCITLTYLSSLFNCILCHIYMWMSGKKNHACWQFFPFISTGFRSFLTLESILWFIFFSSENHF